jgi:glycine cleavage system H protein
MNVPETLVYTDHDEWVKIDGQNLTVGLSDFAQDALGELVHVELPEAGDEVTGGEVAAEVESVKAVAEVYAPVSGTITEVNEDLEDGAEKINADPYGCWLFKMTASESGPYAGLLDAAAYRAKIGA